MKRTTDASRRRIAVAALLLTVLTFLTFSSVAESSRAADATAGGTPESEKPALPDATRVDWLLDPTPFVSDVRFDEAKRELTLTNGLVERRIKLAPNAATVSFRNLTTGEEFVRAVAPEARVSIDGETFPVGGLRGFPIANYLKEDWLDAAEPEPNAFRFESFEVGEIEERFPYRKRPEWSSRDLPWPPKGKRLSLFFAPPVVFAPPSGGPLVFEEPFGGKLADGWDVAVSSAFERTSVANEGKPGEIFALPNVCAYLERDWPDGAVAMRTALDVGDDETSNSWGPGVALLFDGKTVSVVARPNSRGFEVCVDGRESLVGSFERSDAIEIWTRFEKPSTTIGDNGEKKARRLVVEVSRSGSPAEKLFEVDVPGTPARVRVGKVGKGGFGKDREGDPSQPAARVHLTNVAFFGPVSESKAAEARALPSVEVRYEVYDGLPLLSKRLYVRYPKDAPTTEDGAAREFVVDTFVAEELRLPEVDASVDDARPSEKFNIQVESEYCCGGGMRKSNLDPDGEPARLLSDPDYPTQTNYARQALCLLQCSPKLGPSQVVAPGRDFESFAVYELLFENAERERRGLAQRRMLTTLAPWTTENPLMFHLTNGSPDAVREGIRQCAETGFETLIMSFGSGFNLESKDPEYRKVYRALSDEARAAGVALGGYSLTSSRGAATAADNVQNPSPRFGVGPCLCSEWGADYLATLKGFMEDAAFGIFENDGPYPGDFCDTDAHPGHRGKGDSVWNQRLAQAELYRWCRARGIYVNQPDAYFLDGGNKTGMGYRETNWSLPRAEQVIIERQNVYDGTWTRPASAGWMFVPLSQYHGGGAAATIEPLAEHLDHYDARFADLIGAGTQACWRGPRLFDAPETKAVVVKWVDFYKERRRVLDADMIHLRRATGRDWDGWLHVDPNPAARDRALAFLYNPTKETIRREIKFPLYYSGLVGKAVARLGDSDLKLGEPFEVELNDLREATVEVEIPAEKYAWVVFEAAK